MDERTTRMPRPGADAEAEELEQVVRRVARARVRDPHLVDDVVQETLERVFARGDDLEPGARQPYAIVVATNLIATTFRADGRRARHLHRLGDPSSPELPEETFLRRDEHRSMQDAMTRLSPRDREVLVAHEVLDITTKDLAAGASTSSGAIAVRLAAARAKLRVEYVLSHRRESPLPPHCRSVLVALSSRDGRRLAALGADDHLVSCERCASLSEPVSTRSRASAALVPLLAVRWAGGRAWSTVRAHPAPAAVATAAVVTAALVAQSVSGGPTTEALDPGAQARASSTGAPAPSTAPPDAGPVRVGAVGLRSIPEEQLVGERVAVRSALVGEVPADEGFWIEDGAGGRIWVQLVVGGESAVGIRPGTLVSFDGALVETSEGFADEVGVTEAGGAAELAPGAIYVEVDVREVTLR